MSKSAVLLLTGRDGWIQQEMQVGWRRDYGPSMLDRLASYMKKRDTHTHTHTHTHMHVQ